MIKSITQTIPGRDRACRVTFPKLSVLGHNFFVNVALLFSAQT